MSLAIASSGSPIHRPSMNRSQSQENAPFDEHRNSTRHQDPIKTLKKSATALSSSKLANQAPKKMKTIHQTTAEDELNPMDKLLARLSQQQATIDRQREDLSMTADSSSLRTAEFVHAIPNTTAPDIAAAGALETNVPPSNSTVNDEAPVTASELLRLKIELDRAKGQIARMDQELAQSRITKHTIEQAIGTGSEAEFVMSISGDTVDNPLGNLNQPVRLPFRRDNSWPGQDDAHSDTSDALSAGGFNRARNIWANARPQFMNAQAPVPIMAPLSDFRSGQAPYTVYANGTFSGGRGFGGSFNDAASSNFGQQGRVDRLSPDRGDMTGVDRRVVGRGMKFPPRNSYSYANSNGSFDTFPQMNGYGPIGGSYIESTVGYQPPPVATPLSPFAPEFTAGSTGSWKTENGITEGQTYVATTEPLNYRRLLDKTVNCNWKYIVDKIVCSNDQQASIFLQQKLKVGTAEQKYDIVEAIVAQAYPLMVNRFGNFLVQRCFEHGTPEQVIKIAEAIRGNTLNLSMDAFGCHVVQKAFDSVPEEYKAIMVHELLRRIPETVIHRYACHVWQKLFELRWTESPPQIMKYVNEALRGMWHEVALGETGSLVVQNIFENCLEEDKRPCIEEVLEAIDVVAHGQFGNWCIQHICEHGAPADRGRAVDHVIRYATEYSMDQFASKVVEKCLKIGGSEFLHRYLDRVCEGRMDRPRIPLIDISSDQYGNYLIQYILTHSSPSDKEMVACHIRKHMVSLRGSKFGSRVGMLCNNPAIATRPGPGVGPAAGVRMPPQVGPRYPGAYR